METIWDEEIKAFRHGKKVIAPRWDEDGLDLFFQRSFEGKAEADARYCSGEGYWAYPFSVKEIRAILSEFKDMLNDIANGTWDDDLAKAAQKIARRFA